MKHLWKYMLAFVGLVIFASTVWATTITVDGDPSDWPSSAGTQTDGNEAQINDNVDIQTFRWTNDKTYMYFLIDTFNTLSTNPNVWALICLDTDNSDSTGSDDTNPFYDNCNRQKGFERFVRWINFLGTWYVVILDSNGTTVISSSTNGDGRGTDLELRANLTDLFGAGQCPGQIGTVVYFDGGDTNPDDNVPNTGTFEIKCGPPTAVTLETFTGTAVGAGGSGLLPVGLLAVAVLGLLTAGAAVWRRKQ